MQVDKVKINHCNLNASIRVKKGVIGRKNDQCENDSCRGFNSFNGRDRFNRFIIELLSKINPLLNADTEAK